MKAFKFFFILIGILILIIGAKMTRVSSDYDEKIYQDSLKYYQNALEKMKKDSLALKQVLAGTLPPEPSIKGLSGEAANLPSSDFSKTNLNAAQGVEVALKGIEWSGTMMESVQGQLKRNFGARYVNNYNEIIMDPDFPNCGYPDLWVTVPEVPTLTIDDRKSVSRFLRKKINKEKPIESYHLQVGNNKKVRMDLWLANFEVIFRIVPDDKHNRNEEFPYTGKHPITKIDADDIRRKRERNKQRYGYLTVFLEFRPKDTWFIGQPMESGVFKADRQPEIGIAAVECAKVFRIDEKGANKEDTDIYLTIEPGQSIPLYNSLEEVIGQFTDQYHKDAELKPAVETVSADYYKMAQDSTGTFYNPDLFGKTKYSAIQIKNLGSWKSQQGFLFGNTKYEGDLFKAEFLIHLFVIGEWTVKPNSFVETDIRPPKVITKKGLIDFLLPDFKLGFFGKIFSGTVGILILIVFLSVFFPPLGKIVNGVLKKILGIFGDKD